MTSALDRPATARRAGALHAAFRRLGLDAISWRGARLAIAGALTGREGLASLRQLTGGEAGHLIRQLGSCRDCRDLCVHLAWSAQDAQQEAADRAGLLWGSAGGRLSDLGVQ